MIPAVLSPDVLAPAGLPCPVCHVLRHLGQQATAGAATSVFDALTGWVVSGSGWLVNHSVALVAQSTTPDFTSRPFRQREAPMTEMALALLLPLALAGTIGAVLRQDLRRLGRIWLVGVPVAALGTFALVTLTNLAVRLVDGMSSSLLQGRATPFGAVGGDLTRSRVPMVVKLLVGLVLVVCALMLWLEMILRTVVIDIAVFFLPLGLAAIVWPATAHVAKRFVEMLLAVIGCKFVVVGALVMGGVLLRGPGAGTGDAVKAVAVFLLAAFAPFALLRLVPVLELAAVAQLEGLSRRSARALSGAAGTTAGTAAAAVGAGGRALLAGEPVEGGPVGPYGIATRAGDIDVDALGDGDGAASRLGGGRPLGVNLDDLDGRDRTEVGDREAWPGPAGDPGPGPQDAPGDKAGEPGLPDPAELAGPLPVLPASAPGEPPPELDRTGGQHG